MTRIIKGFAVDWGDRWRRTVWAQLEHIYWFNVSPDRQVEFDRSSSPMALNEGDRGRLEATQAVKEEKVAFIAYFNAGVRAVDVPTPYQPKEIGYFLPSIPQATDKRRIKSDAV